MSNAWEVTTDDVLNVLHGMSKKATGDQVHKIMEDLDHFKIECAALCGDDLESQTEHAYREMIRQIEDRKLL